jgi:hypothetical protein
VVAYLGQDPALASHVKVLPVGRRGTDPSLADAASAWNCPCVLYFNPRHILAHQLPKFPDVYRPEEQTLSPPKPEELKTADASPVVSAIPVPALTVPPTQSTPVEGIERPIPHSVVVLPAPSPLVSSEPPMISSLRELERNIPSPEPIKTKKPKAIPPAPTPVTAADLRDDLAIEDDASAETSSWWSTLGWVMIAAAAIGILVRWQWANASPKTSEEGFVPILAEDTKPSPATITPRDEPVVAQRPIALNEDILTALVFNQLPIREQTQEPLPPEEKPSSRKIFRLDPPEEQASAAIKKPYTQTRRKPEPVFEEPVQSTPSADEPTETLSLLDQVLKRANERRAA